MNRISASGSCRISSKDYPDAPNVPQPVTCPYCGSTLYYAGVKFGGMYFWCNQPDPCPCPQAAAQRQAEQEEKQAREQAEQQRRWEAKRDKLIGQSGLSKRFLRRTFATFQVTPENHKAYRTCRKYADAFGNLDADKNSLMLAGNCGTGKTHLAAAIANALLAKMVPVVFTTPNDLTAAVRSSFDTGKDEVAVVRLYQDAPLLVLDDLGKDQPTQWSVALLYRILNARYENDAPVVVTTNYDAAGLVKRLTPPGGDDVTGRAIVDRLTEMCYYLPMTGKSHRQRN